jgi:cytochrome c
MRLKYAPMKRLIVLALLALACNRQETTQTAPATPHAQAAGDATRGRELAGQYGCNVCHVMPGVEGPSGSLGPSLEGLASRPTITAAAVPNDPATLARFIQNPASVNPQSAMPPMAINGPTDVQDLVAYLQTLK